MIKNWTVTTQPVKNGTNGIIAREKYLLSKSHPNHRLTENIISLIGSPNTSKRISLIGEDHKLKQKYKSRKGGRPLSSFAIELCIILPKKIRPSEKNWINIISYICRSISISCKLNKEECIEFKKNIRAVCHQQNQAGSYGSGDHVHLIIGKVINGKDGKGGKVLTKLQKKETTRLVKQCFNYAVLKELGIDHKDYTPKEFNNAKKLEVWRYNQQQFNNIKETQRLINKLQNQTEKWLKSLSDNNIKQRNRQINRIRNTLNELTNKIHTKDTKGQVKNIKDHILKNGGNI